MNQLFTIGHSTHDIDTFLGLLRKHEIDVVADVRSNPVSRFPWFSLAGLKYELKSADFRYVFLGEELGARRTERDCYIGNRADYDLIRQSPAFLSGMERLSKGVEKFRVALMCSEREPLDCHRTILVSREAKDFSDVFHIKADGGIESHPDAEERLTKRYFSGENDLFKSEDELLEEAYALRGKEINYVEKFENSPVVMEDNSYEDDTLRSNIYDRVYEETRIEILPAPSAERNSKSCRCPPK